MPPSNQEEFSSRPGTAPAPLPTIRPNSRGALTPSRRQRTNVGSTNSKQLASTRSVPNLLQTQRSGTPTSPKRGGLKKSGSVNRLSRPRTADLPFTVHSPQASGRSHTSHHQAKREHAKRHQDAKRERYLAHAHKAIMGKIKHEGISRFGSLRGFFRNIDHDGGGDVDFEEFKTALERTGLHTICSEHEQKIVFDRIDENGNGKISYVEFQKLFDPGLMQIASRNPDPEKTKHLDKYHPDTITPRTYNDIERLKEKVVAKILQKSQKAKVAYHNKTRILMNTFKAIDDDGDSALTYEDMERALGPGQLDLGFSKNETKQILLASDKNRDGFISYKEFLDFLQMHDIEPNYSPIFDGRRRQVDKLRSMKTTPLKYEHLHESRVRRLHEQHAHTVLSARSSEHAEPEYPVHNLITPKNVRPRMATGELQRTDMALLNSKLPASGSAKSMGTSAMSLSLGMGSAKARSAVYDPVSTGAELLEKLHRKTEEEMVVPDRFSGTMQFKSEWNQSHFNNSRTGIGSGGIDENSGLYINEDDRFRTSQHRFFGSRPDQLGADAPDLPLSVQAANSSRRKRDIKKGKLDKAMKWMNANAIERENVAAMEDEANLHAKCALRLKYVEKVYMDDYNRNTRLNDATYLPKRGLAGSEAEHRMWHGSNTTIPSGINIAEAKHEKKFFRSTDNSWLSGYASR